MAYCVNANFFLVQKLEKFERTHPYIQWMVRFVCGWMLQWVRNKRKMFQCLVGKEKKATTERTKFTHKHKYLPWITRIHRTVGLFKLPMHTTKSYQFSLLAIVTSDCFLAFFLYIFATFFILPIHLTFFHLFCFIFFIRLRAHVRLLYFMFW